MYGSNISATYKRNTIIGTKNPLDEILLIENFNNNNNYAQVLCIVNLLIYIIQYELFENILFAYLWICRFLFYWKLYICYYGFRRYFRCIVSKTQWVPFDNKFFIRLINSNWQHNFQMSDIESGIITISRIWKINWINKSTANLIFVLIAVYIG